MEEVTYKIESFKGIYILTKRMPRGKIACVKMSYDKNLVYNMKMRLENASGLSSTVRAEDS